MKKWVGVEWWEHKVLTTAINFWGPCIKKKKKRVKYLKKLTVVSLKHLSKWRNLRGWEGKCFYRAKVGWEIITKMLKKDFAYWSFITFFCSNWSVVRILFYTSLCIIIITKLATYSKNNYKSEGHIVLFKLIGREVMKWILKLMDLKNKSKWFTVNQYVWFHFGRQRSEPL